MSNHLPATMSIAFLHPVFEELLGRGIDDRTLALQVGVQKTDLFDAAVSVPANSVYAFLAWATCTTQDPFICARLGERMAGGGWAPLVPLLSSAKTLAEFFQKFSVLAAEQGRAVAYRLELEGSSALWRLVRAPGANCDAAFADAVAAGFFISLLRAASARIWKPEEITAVLPDVSLVPADIIPAASLLTGEPGLVLRFPSAFVNLPMPPLSARPGLPALQVSATDEQPLAERVKNLMRGRVSDPAMTVEDIAHRLGMATWKLQTLLKQNGTSFAALRNDLRRDLAIQMVSTTDDPVSGIAAQLGYTNSSNFTRAFKTWTGLSPRAFRHK